MSRARSLHEAVRERCRSLPGAVVDYPWGPEEEVYKVGGKAFAFMGTGDPPFTVSLKCDPNRVPGLRAVHSGITVPHYLNKNHWNSVAIDERIPRDELLDLVSHSYEMVVTKLPKRVREELAAPAGRL